MNMPFSGIEMYEHLCNQRCGLDVASITEVEASDNGLPNVQLFHKYNIPYDEFVGFKDGSDDSLHVGYGESPDVKGWATNYIHNGEFRTIIFIVANPEYSDMQLDDEEHLEMISILKSMTLLHELGHVHDIQNSINYDLSNRRVDLVRAEAYADIFAIKKLKRWKGPSGKYALQTMSASILERRFSSEFYSQVHRNITKKVLESHMRKWAQRF